MKKSFLLLVFLLIVNLASFAQVPPDADKDGIPDSEDVCPGIAGTKANKGCPINGSIKTVILNNELSDQDKTLFLANFQKVLQQIPGRFQKLKTGEDELDFTSRTSWFKSNLQLFPNHSDKSKTQLMYGTYNSKPVIAFIENAPVNVNTIVNILMPVLKAKGMVEVNTKFVMDDPAARSFRSKDAVLQINSVASTGGSSLSIGKIPYYYEGDVKPITAAKPKPVVVAAKNELVELKQAILKANEAAKKNKDNPFSIFISAKTGKNLLFVDAKESVWQVKNMFNTVVTSEDEVCIQAAAASEEIAARFFINPCQSLAKLLGTGYKIINDSEGNYMARFENINITYTIMEGSGGLYAPFIFLRPANKQLQPEKENNISEYSIAEQYITPTAFATIVEAVCQRSIHLKVSEKIEEDKTYTTSFAKNGKHKNLPVYYKQTLSNFFTTSIGLSDNVDDFEDVVTYINSLFSTTNTCSNSDRKLKLAYNKDSQNYYDVYASKDGGLFAYVEKEKVNGKDIVQLRMTNYYYAAAGKEKVEPSNLASCADLELILNECVKGYKNVKGSFVKKETPADFYNTSLPSLGFKNKNVVETINIEFEKGEMIRKKIIYFDVNQDFSSSGEALNNYEAMRTKIKNCYSGTVNVSDENNQKIYELFTDYKGEQIRIALIYLNLFGSSSVSITFRINE